MGAARVRHPAEEPVQLIALGGGVLRVQELVSDPVAVGADEAHLGVQLALQQMLEQVRGGGLAAGAGDADQLHLPGGIAEEVPAGQGEPQAAVVRLHEGRSVLRRRFAEHRRGAPLHRLGNEAMSVRLKAPHRHEEIPRLGLAGVVAHAADLQLRIRRHLQHPNMRKKLLQFHVVSSILS